MTLPLRFLAVLILGFAVALAAPSADLTTIAGKSFAGTPVGADAQTLEFKDAAGTVLKFPIKEIGLVDLKNPIVAPWKDAKYDELEMTDGSILRGNGLTIKLKAVELLVLVPPNGAVGPKIDVPLGSLFYVLRGADDAKNRENWKVLLTKRGKRDLFVIRDGDNFNSIPGTVIDGTEAGDRVNFEREDTGTRSPLPLTRATGGIVFNQPPRDVVPPTVCKVFDVFGNIWFATSIEIVGSGIKLKTVAGATVEYASLQGVSKLDFSQGNVTYLSDLFGDAVYPAPEKDGPLAEAFPYSPVMQKDKALDGADIMLGGRKYARGLSIPPDSVLTYKLDGNYREFKAVPGILDRVKPENVTLKLRIEVDGRSVFSQVISKKVPPAELTLNVKDAKELKIVVERESLTLSANQLNLADARVQK